jgi:hypothetical protein
VEIPERIKVSLAYRVSMNRSQNLFPVVAFGRSSFERVASACVVRSDVGSGETDASLGRAVSTFGVQVVESGGTFSNYEPSDFNPKIQVGAPPALASFVQHESSSNDAL